MQNFSIFHTHTQTHCRQTSDFCCCCCFCRWAKVQFVVKCCMNFLKAHKFYKHTMCQLGLRGSLKGGERGDGLECQVYYGQDMQRISQQRGAWQQEQRGSRLKICANFSISVVNVSCLCSAAGRGKSWGVCVVSNRRFCVCQAPLTTTTTRRTTVGIATMAVSRLQFARQQCESNQSQSSNTISQICTSMCSQLCVCQSVCVWVSVCSALLRQLPGTFAILIALHSNCLAVPLSLSVSLNLSFSLTLPP